MVDLLALAHEQCCEARLDRRLSTCCSTPGNCPSAPSSATASSWTRPSSTCCSSRLRLPTMRAPWRKLHRPRRPRRVAHRPPARRARQPRGRRPRAPAPRAAPGRGEAAAGQDAGDHRLHPRPGGVEGASARAGERRCLGRGMGERAPVRPARKGLSATWPRRPMPAQSSGAGSLPLPWRTHTALRATFRWNLARQRGQAQEEISVDTHRRTGGDPNRGADVPRILAGALQDRASGSTAWVHVAGFNLLLRRHPRDRVGIDRPGLPG